MPLRLIPSAALAGFAVLLVALPPSSAAAQEPAITALSVHGMRPGETLDLKVQGGNLTGATQLWTSFPAEAVLSPDVQGNGQNAAEITFRVSVPPDAPLGVHGLRVVTPGGASGLRLFVLDDLPAVTAAGSNTQPASAQSVTLPTAIDGRIPSLTLHYFKFRAETGQRIALEVFARRLGSALDPMLRLFDAQGHELTYSDDAPGLSGDAQICHTFTEAGEYVLELRDIRYQGGDDHFYRLRIGDFPCVTTAYPLGVQRGQDATITVAGADVENVEPITMKVPNDASVNWLPLSIKRTGSAASAFAVVSVGDRAEFLETEPNDSAEQANRVDLAAHLNGRLDRPGDADRFVFTAKKGQAFAFQSVTRQQGSPSDLFLRVLDAAGAKKAEVDDSGSLDGTLSFTAPEDGDYTLLVEDLNRRGGSEFVYRIAVQPARPEFSLSLSADRLNVPAGGTQAVTVTADRRNYGGPIRIEAVGLQEGVTSTPTVIGPGQSSVVLTLQSAPNAAAGRLNSVHIVGKAEIDGQTLEAGGTVSAEAFKEPLHDMPFPPRTLTGAVAVALAPAPAFTLRAEPQSVTIGPGKPATIKLIAQRQPGFDQEIQLKTNPEKNGLPKNISAALKPIPAGQSEIEIVFTATDKAAAGELTAVIVGTLKKDKATVVQNAPGIGVKVEKP
ncbi:MAG: PPC domain-containing protein [Planctomycetaceae bacterium]